MQARLGALLTVCAIAVRVLIPAGYMVAPAHGQGGLPAIVICTAQGAKTLAVDASGAVQNDQGAPKPADGKANRDHGCVFAGAVTPLPVPSLTLARAEAFTTLWQIDLLVAHQRPGLGLAAPPPFKTGPPSIV
ncbi:hypothetical protein [Caulobacter sp.]|uniref:hypothetical protein n=1 Tax=Caulobacter sp. TaxID=78 RepID=UPI003BAEBE20